MQSWPHPSLWYFCCTYTTQALDIFAVLILSKTHGNFLITFFFLLISSFFYRIFSEYNTLYFLTEYILSEHLVTSLIFLWYSFVIAEILHMISSLDMIINIFILFWFSVWAIFNLIWLCYTYCNNLIHSLCFFFYS